MDRLFEQGINCGVLMWNGNDQLIGTKSRIQYMWGLVLGVLNHHILSLLLYVLSPSSWITALRHFKPPLPSSCFLSHHPIFLPSPRDVVPAPRLCRSQPREMIKTLQGGGCFQQGSGGNGSGVSGGRGEHWERRFRSYVALYLHIHNGWGPAIMDESGE